MTPAIKSVELSTVTLPYVEQGDPSGVPVLFVHGYANSSRSFAPLLPPLPGSFHAVALSQRGHGDASPPAEGYKLAISRQTWRRSWTRSLRRSRLRGSQSLVS